MPQDGDDRLNVVVVGCGAWGRNLVRTFDNLPGARLAAMCDRDEKQLARISAAFPDVPTHPDLGPCLQDPDIDAVVIAASAVAHRDLALASLAAGKHTLVEKPLALSVADSEEMVNAAEARGLTLMVGHLLLYHSAVLYAMGFLVLLRQKGVRLEERRYPIIHTARAGLCCHGVTNHFVDLSTFLNTQGLCQQFVLINWNSWDQFLPKFGRWTAQKSQKREQNT